MKTYCLCCSSRTIEINSFTSYNAKDFQSTVTGLRCVQCSQLLCINCIKKLSDAIGRIENDVHSDFQQFVTTIKNFSNNSKVTIEEPFIGHCCIIKLHRETQRCKEQLYNSNKVNLLKRKGSKGCDHLARHYGGAFCIPAYKLMIQTDTKSMDVFGIGRDFQQEALLHYVIDEQCADDLMMQGFYPQPKQPTNWLTQEKDIEITLPHVLTNKKTMVCYLYFIISLQTNFISFILNFRLICFIINIQFKVLIHIIPHLDNDENEIKGSNKINGEDVSNYYLFPKGNSNGYDITFVIGCNEK